MILYRLEDRTSGAAQAPLSDLRLKDVFELTDWSEDDVDQIASLQPGDCYETPEGIYVERMK